MSKPEYTYWKCTNCNEKKDIKDIKETFFIGLIWDDYDRWAICKDCYDKLHNKTEASCKN